MFRMIEAAAGGLEMALGLFDFGLEPVMEQRIRAGQTGSRRQEHREQDNGIQPGGAGRPK